jgi:hypothetical protein
MANDAPPPSPQQWKGELESEVHGSDFLLEEAIQGQLRDSETWWDAATDDNLAKLAQRVRNLPEIEVALPWLKGFGPALQKQLIGDENYLDFLEGLTGPLVRRIDPNVAVRSYGRAVGDASAPPLLGVGWALTLAPEQIKDLKEGAPASEHLADAIIDTTGFAVSEASGWGLGALLFAATGENPIAGFVGKFIGDFGAGIYYDIKAEEGGWREELQAEIEKIYACLFVGENTCGVNARNLGEWLEEDIRVPTPGPQTPLVPAETPQPPDPSGQFQRETFDGEGTNSVYHEVEGAVLPTTTPQPTNDN